MIRFITDFSIIKMIYAYNYNKSLFIFSFSKPHCTLNCHTKRGLILAIVPSFLKAYDVSHYRVDAPTLSYRIEFIFNFFFLIFFFDLYNHAIVSLFFFLLLFLSLLHDIHFCTIIIINYASENNE